MLAAVLDGNTLDVDVGVVAAGPPPYCVVAFVTTPGPLVYVLLYSDSIAKMLDGTGAMETL
jgi:hypothetical protein